MISKMIFASKNRNKVKEIKNIFANSVSNVIALDDSYEDIAENGSSFYENALIKATAVYKDTNIATLADDSGLCIEALDGKPGIHSARYAGENKTDAQRIQKVLSELSNIKDINKRRAYFTTSAVVVLSEDEIIHTEGFVYGHICFSPIGENGFGYDAIFIADGYEKTFAQMTAIEKNSISHRHIAMSKINDILLNSISLKIPK